MEETFNIGRIRAIQTIYNKIGEMQASLAEISEPILSDYSLLPMMYDAFAEVFYKRGCPENATKVYHRKKLLLIIVSLYSPMALVGGRLRVGLRSQIAKLFNLNSETSISDNVSSVINDYNIYRDFRRDVDIIYRAISHRLED